MKEKISCEQLEYYKQTSYDYHVVWDNSEYTSAHFGFYNENASKHIDALANTNRVLADMVKIRPNEKVLDAGCGWGGSSLWLAKFRSADVTGITPVTEQIDKCNIKAKELNLLHKIKFVKADFRSTGFSDNYFDIVWAIESVCHAKNKLDFYKEAIRILKPGGRLIVAEYIRKKRGLKRKENKIVTSWLKNHAIPDIDTRDEHFNNINAAGYSNIKIEDYTSQVRVSVRNLHEKSIRCLPIESILRFFGFRSAIQHGNLIGSIKIWRALKKDLWFYAVITAIKK